MKHIHTPLRAALALALAALFAAGPAFAEKDGHGKHDKHGKKHAKHSKHHGDDRVAGHGCPPGLAKKHNGCMPPGQAKKYSVGHRLPGDVRYYAVPQPVIAQLPPPPRGHRYVRVDRDILLLSPGAPVVVNVFVGRG